MQFRKIFSTLLLSAMMMTAGCSDSDDNSGVLPHQSDSSDLVVSNRIDDQTGFVNMVDGTTDRNITNANGVEINPGCGVFVYNGFIYTTGSRNNDKITKYAVQSDNSLTKVAETVVYESGGSIPTNFIFVDDAKAYVTLAGIGELLTVNPTDLSITKRIDLSPYALDENGATGGSDTNPEASGGVIRDDKLYLALGQIVNFTTFYCRGKASVLIIDTATDAVLKHITDERTCCSGVISPNHGLTMDENGDIYVNNTASFGYYPGLTAGYLRINNGEDEFDPDYFFSVTDLQNLDVPGNVASYAYNEAYFSGGLLYTTLFIPALTSNPPDYVNDKNFQPYVMDLYNRTATKLDMPSSIGWSIDCINYNGEIVYGLSTINGTGLYRAGESTPFITTEGNPFFLFNY
ncbi:MAG: hypothetical protein ABIK15_16740 [Pseudomonadota bacterium]